MRKINRVDSPVNLFADDAHRERAAHFHSILEQLTAGLTFDGLPVSERQIYCIATFTTDERLSDDAKKMLAALTLKSGPDMDRPVPEDELIAAVASFDAVDLLIAEPAGRA